jgi:hypothetical protein
MSDCGCFVAFYLVAHILDILSRLAYRWHQSIDSTHSPPFKLEQFIAMQLCVPWGVDRLASFVLFGALLQLNRESSSPLYTLLIFLDTTTSAIQLYIVVQLLQGFWDRRQSRAHSQSNLAWHAWLHDARGAVGFFLGTILVFVSLAQEAFMLLLYFRGFAGSVAAAIAATNAGELHEDDDRMALEQTLTQCYPLQVALGEQSVYLVRWLLDHITLQGEGTAEMMIVYAMAAGAVCKAGIGLVSSAPLLS